SCSGYALTYHEVPAWRRDVRLGFNPCSFEEELARGGDVCLVLNHDESQVLARRSDGTLVLSTDSTGLRFEAYLRRSPVAEMLYSEFFSDGLRGCSISWDQHDSERQGYSHDGGRFVEITKARGLRHISVQIDPDQPCFASTRQYLHVGRLRGS